MEGTFTKPIPTWEGNANAHTGKVLKLVTCSIDHEIESR